MRQDRIQKNVDTYSKKCYYLCIAPGGYLTDFTEVHSEIRLVAAVQYSKIDIGFHDFHYNCIMYRILVAHVPYEIAEILAHAEIVAHPQA